VGDLQSLAWELLAEVSSATSRIVVDPESAHRRLVDWLGTSRENVAHAETWLAVCRAERASPTPFEHPPRDEAIAEFHLRRPITEVIWGKPPGGGTVGFVNRRGRWRRVGHWLDRFRRTPRL
jgi:hypothetical protein